MRRGKISGKRIAGGHADDGRTLAVVPDHLQRVAAAIMPNPGGGIRIAGYTPQQVLFFVTDGLEDKTVNGRPCSH
jgi:hypothetical protein